MNLNIQTVIQASDAGRRGVFLTTATRLGTAVQHVEKEFWVCWVLDALFNGLPPEGPRLLFQGGTSLSKSFGLISRFSEDIDITVFRQDIGEPIEVSDLHALSGKQRPVRLSRIRNSKLSTPRSRPRSGPRWPSRKWLGVCGSVVAKRSQLRLREALERYQAEIVLHKKSKVQEASTMIKMPLILALALRPLASIRGADLGSLRDAWLAIMSHVLSVARKEWGMESLSNPVEVVRKPTVRIARTRHIQEIEQPARGRIRSGSAACRLVSSTRSLRRLARSAACDQLHCG